ncbi:MAG: hypothetical protein IKR83_03245 [Bacteroidales bacterium]|nr:hypothetical protein [Bacteroidales bacterium]
MTTKTRTLTRIGIVDAALLTTACLIPAASHLLAFPLYMLNPMLALLLAAIILGRDWRNALVMAVLLPAISFLFTGMPTASKMVCMMAEYAVVASIFGLLQRKWSALPAVLVAILAGKVAYYALKVAIIAPSVLVSTEWTIQLIAVMLWAGLFALLYKKI